MMFGGCLLVCLSWWRNLCLFLWCTTVSRWAQHLLCIDVTHQCVAPLLFFDLSIWLPIAKISSVVGKFSLSDHEKIFIETLFDCLFCWVSLNHLAVSFICQICSYLRAGCSSQKWCEPWDYVWLYHTNCYMRACVNTITCVDFKQGVSALTRG